MRPPAAGLHTGRMTKAADGVPADARAAAGEAVTADDGVRLWAARPDGGGDPLVLCHGGPGLWDMFGDVAALLADRTPVVRWDQRGCGRSERCAGPWTTARFVADLDAVRRHFGLDRMAPRASARTPTGIPSTPPASSPGSARVPNGSRAGGSWRRCRNATRPRSGNGPRCGGRWSSRTGIARWSTPGAWPSPGSESTRRATGR
ncbi:alpha/beta fold hydrolase [Streptomyces olivaceoviridis]|uniref:alpha/beta fold hydrolase n=1 Tax=Streptomyces olivaceoviridis TaxID=1921 RepID=UPI0037B7C654